MEELGEQESIDSDRYNYNHLPDDIGENTRAIPWWKCKRLDKEQEREAEELKRRKEDDEEGEVKGADYQNSYRCCRSKPCWELGLYFLLFRQRRA